MTADVKLLPCPFCDGRPYMQSDSDVDGCYWSKVRCSSCDVATRGKWASSSANTCPQWYAEVREEWNTRACVAHATAAKDAEIEALRAEAIEWRGLFGMAKARADKAEARAERLAEALRNSSDALERLAFAIRAPNAHTPQLVELAIAMRATALAALRDHGQEGKNG